MVFFKDGDSIQNDGHRLDGNKNYMSFLNSGRNTHRGSFDANTMKFTSLFDETPTSSSKKPQHAGDFKFASVFVNVPHNAPHKSTGGLPTSGERPCVSSVHTPDVGSKKFTSFFDAPLKSPNEIGNNSTSRRNPVPRHNSQDSQSPSIFGGKLDLSSDLQHESLFDRSVSTPSNRIDTDLKFSRLTSPVRTRTVHTSSKPSFLKHAQY